MFHRAYPLYDSSWHCKTTLVFEHSPVKTWSLVIILVRSVVGVSCPLCVEEDGAVKIPGFYYSHAYVRRLCFLSRFWGPTNLRSFMPGVALTSIHFFFDLLVFKFRLNLLFHKFSLADQDPLFFIKP